MAPGQRLSAPQKHGTPSGLRRLFHPWTVVLLFISLRRLSSVSGLYSPVGLSRPCSRAFSLSRPRPLGFSQAPSRVLESSSATRLLRTPLGIPILPSATGLRHASCLAPLPTRGLSARPDWAAPSPCHANWLNATWSHLPWPLGPWASHTRLFTGNG